MDWVADFVLVPVCGAVIGYFTNWLAIKMLFRPHEKKMVGKLQVPFTPGLLAKERYRLSKKVGETVGNHLLTKEVLAEAFHSQQTMETMNRLLDNALGDLADNRKTLYQWICQLEGGQESFNRVKDGFMATTMEWLENSGFEHEVAAFAWKELKPVLETTEVKNGLNQLWDAAGPALLDKGGQWLQSASFSGLVQQFTEKTRIRLLQESKPVASFIPQRAMAGLKAGIGDVLPKTGGLLEDFLKKHPEIDKKLEQLVEQIIKENLGRFLGVFFNARKVYDNIVSGVTSYLKDEENQKHLIRIIEAWLDKTMEEEVGTWAGKIPEEFWETTWSVLLRETREQIASGSFEQITAFVKTNLEGGSASIYHVLCGLTTDLDGKAISLIEAGLRKYKENKMEQHVTRIFTWVEQKVFHKPIGEWLTYFDREKCKVRLSGIARFIVVHGAGYLAQSIQVGDIVEKQINSFDMQTGEDIILSVVKKELRAITFVGGVLGFVIGIVPGLIRLFT